MECVQVSIPTIGIEKSFEYHLEICTRTICVALSADLNDREFRILVMLYMYKG